MDSTALPDVEGGLFDTHLHIIAPGFPLIPNRGYTPDFFTVDDHLVRNRWASPAEAAPSLAASRAST